MVWLRHWQFARLLFYLTFLALGLKIQIVSAASCIGAGACHMIHHPYQQHHRHHHTVSLFTSSMIIRQQRRRRQHIWIQKLSGALVVTSQKCFSRLRPGTLALMVLGIVAVDRLMGLTNRPLPMFQNPGMKPSSTNDNNNDKDEETKTGNDDTQNPRQQPKTKDANAKEPIMSTAMVTSIGFYKQFISPLLPPACRFVPTCSQYGVQAIQEFGPGKGAVLIAWRLLRCSPIGGKGYDPPKWPPVPYTYSSY